MSKQITLQFVTRTLTRLKHATSLGPNVLSYALVKAYWGKPSQLRAVSAGDGRAADSAN